MSSKCSFYQKMNRICSMAACLLFLVPCIAGDEGREIKKSPLDHVILYQSSISKDVPIRIREFPTDNADLGTGANAMGSASGPERARSVRPA